jgi:hypothetical protein
MTSRNAYRSAVGVKFDDLYHSFMFASFEGMGDQAAYLCIATGETHWHSEFGDNFEELPDDIDDEEKYIRLPNKRDLDLGKPLVMSFVRQFLPEDIDEVRDYFRRRGAYAKFKSLLARRRAIDRWHDFENKAEEQALREWCKDNSIELED